MAGSGWRSCFLISADRSASGPPLALCIGALWSTGAALAAGGIVLLLATTAFAAQPASRSWRPAPAQRRPRGGSLRAPAMRTLVIVLIAVGVLLGADEVAVVAAAKTLDSTTAAAPLLALWGAGSFVGGLLIARLGGGARTAAGLALVLAALTAGHLALIPAAGSVPALGAVLFLAGAAIAPTEATMYAMVDDAAPAGTMTEAFAWLATAMAVGGAGGATSAGILIDRAGPTAAFALAGGAGALAALMTMLRSRTLVPRAPAIADTVAATGTASIVANATPAPAVDRKGARLVTALFDVVAPIVLYYGLRAAGVGIYLALLAGAVAPGISTVGRLIRVRTVDRRSGRSPLSGDVPGAAGDRSDQLPPLRAMANVAHPGRSRPATPPEPRQPRRRSSPRRALPTARGPGCGLAEHPRTPSTRGSWTHTTIGESPWPQPITLLSDSHKPSATTTSRRSRSFCIPTT